MHCHDTRNLVWRLLIRVSYFTWQMGVGPPGSMCLGWFSEMTGTWSRVSFPSYVEGVDLPNFMDNMWSSFKLFCEGFYPGFWEEICSSYGFVSGAKTFTLPNESLGFSPLRVTNLYDVYLFCFVFLFFSLLVPQTLLICMNSFYLVFYSSLHQQFPGQWCTNNTMGIMHVLS